MVGVRRDALADRDSFEYQYGGILCDGAGGAIPDFVLEAVGPTRKLTFKLHIPLTEMVKTLACDIDDTVDKII